MSATGSAVSDPASGWLLAGALALLGFLKWRLKCR